MKMTILSSKLNRFLIVFVAILLILLGIRIYFGTTNEIYVNLVCDKTESEKYCTFDCSLLSEEDVRGRITVTHTVWASIYEKTFDLKKNEKIDFQIQLPRRTFVYWLRGGFWNKTDRNFEYGVLERDLFC